MISTYLSLEAAIANLEIGLETKGSQTGLQRNKVGYTCFANSLKVVKQYAKATSSVPTAAAIANKFLEENCL